MSDDPRLFSLVVPVLNEEEVIGDTYRTLNQTLEDLGMPFEVLVVDNASTDRTPAIMAAICGNDPRWRFIRLSRNFGYQNSCTAGMLSARGDAIMLIDADLQDPPELIQEFVAKWREGYDVVYGVREKRTGEPWLRVFPTMLAMRFITWMSDEVKLPLHSGDFRLISRRVRDAFAHLPEATRYLRGMIHWLGFKQIGIPYVRRGRTKGKTKVNFSLLFGFMFNAVFNFSIKPLRMFSFLGLGIIGLTIVLAMVYLVMSFLTNPPPGLTTVLMLLLMNLGVTSLGIGILGEYVAKIYAESKRRPLWLVDYTLNMEGQAAPGIVSGLLGGRDEFGAALAQHRPAPSSSSEAA
ncbi:MAG TPA: glycosyltransferase family 2 protein [Gemmataceae bacterium]|jgi:dolichol-phosphate mannosyltransferase|nr:glycosyltransferase family 2 protein [Gemmataceae bacterium]